MIRPVSKSNRVDFLFNKEENCWMITYEYRGNFYYFSVSNTWNTDISEMKCFNYLHVAVNYAKRRNFNYKPVPEFTYDISNNTMQVYVNDVFLKEHSDVMSDTQALQILKKEYKVNLNKIEY